MCYTHRVTNTDVRSFISVISFISSLLQSTLTDYDFMCSFICSAALATVADGVVVVVVVAQQSNLFATSRARSAVTFQMVHVFVFVYGRMGNK